tara:strand:- start:775 stop:954 length:180 start_codon:yes stop_codon:yes gene_type:complete
MWQAAVAGQHHGHHQVESGGGHQVRKSLKNANFHQYLVHFYVLKSSHFNTYSISISFTE